MAGDAIKQKRVVHAKNVSFMQKMLKAFYEKYIVRHEAKHYIAIMRRKTWDELLNRRK